MKSKDILFVIFIILGILAICFLLRSGKSKKKGKKKEKKNETKKTDSKTKQEKGKAGGEKKIEPALKKKTAEPEKVEEEKTLEKEQPKEKEKFHVVRRKNELKINKQALKSGSRNPSVTRVFDKNGKIPTEEKVEEEKKVAKVEEVPEKKPVERFGTRDYEYSEENTSTFFQINAPKGSPLRAPTIGDRTNFTERLRVSEDGNLSGVLGIGIHGAVAQAESQAKAIDDKNKEMLDRVDDSLNGQLFGDLYAGLGQEEKPKGKSPLEKIDAETLILVDAINNPRHKKPHSPKN